MEYKYEFKNDTEKNVILNDNKEKFLIEEQYLLNGNFLIFSDIPVEKEIVYVNVPQEEMETLKAENTELKETVDLILTEIIPSLMA